MTSLEDRGFFTFQRHLGTVPLKACRKEGHLKYQTQY